MYKRQGYSDALITKGLLAFLISGLNELTPNEVDIRSLKKKFTLALPRCKDKKELLFYPWDEEPLTKDSEGILSPNNSSSLSYLQISMILVPCLSVDKNLTRLGYGGGYFDKLRLSLIHI